MKRALVIEDNEDNMVLITKLLRKGGYKMIPAENGRRGYELALLHRPDFILLDIQLPDIEGTEVLRMIRSSRDRQICSDHCCNFLCHVRRSGASSCRRL